jgi:hypothetical protein
MDAVTVPSKKMEAVLQLDKKSVPPANVLVQVNWECAMAVAVGRIY